MKIKEIRQNLGLSQSKFAQYFDLNKRSLENWESGRYATPRGISKLIMRIVYLEKKLGIKKEDYNSDVGGDDNDE